VSIEALKWAFEQEDVPPGPRFVLVALANRANEEGGDLYPSLRWIQKKTGIPERTIRQHMTDLQRRGLLVKTERRREDGGRTSNEYRLPLTQPGLRFNTPPAAIAGGAAAIAGGTAAPAGHPRQPLPEPPATIAGHETKDQTKETRKGGRPRPGVEMPPEFKISPEVREWARKHGYEPYLELHFEKLVDYAKSGTQDGKPVLAIDWDAKFRTCIRDDWGEVREKAKRASVRGGGAPLTAWRPGAEPNDVLNQAARSLQIEPWQTDAGETHGQFRARIIDAGGEALLKPQRIAA
jgi:hypothetical protein